MVHWGFYVGLFLVFAFVSWLNLREIAKLKADVEQLTFQNDDLLDENTDLVKNVRAAYCTGFDECKSEILKRSRTDPKAYERAVDYVLYLQAPDVSKRDPVAMWKRCSCFSRRYR
jgi:hypothetical protein